MRSAFRVCLFACFFLVACNRVQKPSDENFKKAINEYLAKHGRTCASIGRPFPVDVSVSSVKDEQGTGPQMIALEQAGLVRSSEVMAETAGVLGSGTRRLVKRYEVSD